MRNYFVWGLIILWALTVSSVFANDVVVAQVNNEKVKLKDFARLLKKSNLTKKEMSQNIPAYKNALNMLVDQILINQYVIDNKLVEEGVIKDSLDIAVMKYVLQRWMQKEYQKIKVTEKDMKNFYAKNRDKMKSPDAIEIATITYEQKNEHAIKALKEVRASKDIEQAFKDHIAYPRWVNSSNIPSDMYKVISKLKVGEMSKEYVHVGRGFHLFYLKAKREGKLLSYDQVKSSLVNPTKKYLLDKKIENRYKKLRKNAQITYDKKTGFPVVDKFRWTDTIYEKYFLDSDKKDWEQGYSWRMHEKSFKNLSKDIKKKKVDAMVQVTLLFESIKKDSSFQQDLLKIPVLNFEKNLKVSQWKIDLKSSVVPTIFEKLKCINDDSVPVPLKSSCIKNYVYEIYLKDTIYHLRKNSYIKLFIDKEYKKGPKVKKITLKDDSEMIKKCSDLSMNKSIDETSRFIAIEAKCSNFLVKDVRKFCKKVSRRNKKKNKGHLDIFCANYTTSYKEK